MLKEIRGELRSRVDGWLFRIRPAEALPVVLRQRRIFVLPTRFGVAFAFTLLVMLLTSINYNLSLGYALTFSLGGIGMVSILHAFRNLLHLEIHPAACPPVHAGTPATFTLRLRNDAGRPRTALLLSVPGGPAGTPFDIAPHENKSMAISLPTTRRGWITPGRVTLSTTYPLGMIKAWSVFAPDLRCLVYACPETPSVPIQAHGASSAGAAVGNTGKDDFVGFREYQRTDSPGHIAWRLAAKCERLLTKQFDGGDAVELELDWSDLPAALGTEERLSRLTRWTLLAEAAGIPYSLRIPGRIVQTGYGPAHRDRCLRTLALFGHRDE